MDEDNNKAEIDFLGQTFKKPSKKENDKWNYVEIDFSDDGEFNEATSKIMKILFSKKQDSSGQCIVSDSKGIKYLLEIVHCTFDTFNHCIKVLPHSCENLMALN